MKKTSALLFLSFLFVGMFATSFVLADSDNGNRLSVAVSARNSNDAGDDSEWGNKLRVGDSMNGLEVRSELKIRERADKENGTRLRVRLNNGTETELRVLPERAAEIARERLRAKNVTIEVRERQNEDNIPRVVYLASGEIPGKFLGIFKIRARYQTSIDAETGEVVEFNGPWWAFLISESTEVEIDSESENNVSA